MKIVFFNAPPRSGKDEAVDNYIATFIGKHRHHVGLPYPQKLKLAEPIKSSLKALLGLTDKEFFYFDNHEKDTPQPRLMGHSWRQLCVKMSEDFTKVIFDKQYFGRVLGYKIKSLVDLPHHTPTQFLVSDGGFDYELEPVINMFGNQNIHVIKIRRPDHEWGQDSRGWIDCNSLNIYEHELINDGSLEDFRKKSYDMIEGIFNDNK
jgi:hypothetical protein